MSESFLNGRVILHGGDNREVLRSIPDASIDSIVTDPPYALVSIGKRYGKDGSAPPRTKSNMHDKTFVDPNAKQFVRLTKGFMGKQWDTGETAFAVEFWAECLRVLKPGGHVVAFSGTRTYHRMACAIEDAGFEIRDQLQWVYGSGFPKSHDVSKGIDKAAGAEREKVKDYNPRNPKATGGGRDGMEGATRPWIETAIALGYHEKAGDVPVTEDAIQWQGWGTALKPATEPICFARKPLIGTVAANVLAHGVGALNIGACRVVADDGENRARPPRTPNETLKGGTILDPFAGTGTTGEAAFREGFNAVLIEREAEYQTDIRRRMALCMAGPDERKRESIKAKVGDLPFEPGSLFA